jgi:moderate conductance mechanosensitive channel
MSWSAPAAVLGAALGFGAQRIVQDLLSGFFIITEKQCGFGDLVELSVTNDVLGRVAKLRWRTAACGPPSADSRAVADGCREHRGRGVQSKLSGCRTGTLQP